MAKNMVSFAAGLHVVRGTPTEHGRADEGIQRLYGDEVLPNGLRSILNVDMRQLIHVSNDPSETIQDGDSSM
mgnify:CR=1 FL=1|jgi:hypothetical protein